MVYKNYDMLSLQQKVNEIDNKCEKGYVDEKVNKINSSLEDKANKDDVANISSGTPLFSSSVSEMTDTTRNYVNLADGYLYIYNSDSGSFEKSTLQYQSTGLSDGQVTPSKISLVENYLDMSIQNGQYTTQGSTSPIDSTNTCITIDDFKLKQDDIIYLIDTDYKYTICRFIDGVHLYPPDTWIENESLVLSDYNQQITDAMTIRLQIRRKDGANINASELQLKDILKVNSYLKITHENLEDCSVNENKLTDELKNKINSISNNKIVDLVMFMGQSNMAGRGVASESPVVPNGHGYEFRAISDPTKLYDIVEPFGVNENNISSGVNETNKTGSMVSSFVKAYYEVTKIPIVAVSCSKGGTVIDWWQPNGLPLNDAINRHNTAKEWLLDNGYTIRHDFMVWCQGCSDGDSGTTKETYTDKTKLMIEEMMKHGIEKCFLVRIGNHRDNATLYDNIIEAQTELCKTWKHTVLVSTKFCSMATDGLMKDEFHYKQEGYNITGRDAGINTAFYINNLKEPTMYDWENQNLYFSQKN